MTMAIKNIIAIAMAVAIINGCSKPCNEPDYSFSITESFSPEKDSINVGDTMWLVSETPVKMQDITTQARIDYSGAANFGSTLQVIDISKTQSTEIGAVDSFTYIKVIGDIFTDEKISPTKVKQLSFNEINGMYKIKIGIIAQKKGAYILFVGNAANIYRTSSPKCGKASIEILNNNVNQHLFLYEDLYGSLSDFDKQHAYCFIVS